jgi:hypothetical protein
LASNVKDLDNDPLAVTFMELGPAAIDILSELSLNDVSTNWQGSPVKLKAGSAESEP